MGAKDLHLRSRVGAYTFRDDHELMMRVDRAYTEPSMPQGSVEFNDCY